MGRRIVIVGGGISGLATAWQIRRHAPDIGEIILLESSSQVGGTAQTIERDGYLLETGPNGFLDSRAAALNLCKLVGLEEELVRAAPTARNRYVFLGDHLRPIPLGPWEFLTSDLFPSRRSFVSSPSGSSRLEGMMPTKRFSISELGESAGKQPKFCSTPSSPAFSPATPSYSAYPPVFPRMREMELQYGGLFRAMSALARERRREHQQSPPVPVSVAPPEPSPRFAAAWEDSCGGWPIFCKVPSVSIQP